MRLPDTHHWALKESWRSVAGHDGYFKRRVLFWFIFDFIFYVFQHKNIIFIYSTAMIENGIWAVCNNSSLGIKRRKFSGYPLMVQQFVFFVFRIPYLGELLLVMKMNLEDGYFFFRWSFLKMHFETKYIPHSQ